MNTVSFVIKRTLNALGLAFIGETVMLLMYGIQIKPDIRCGLIVGFTIGSIINSLLKKKRLNKTIL